MGFIPGDSGQKSIFGDGIQIDHISENTAGHGTRVRGISSPTPYPIITGDVGEEIKNATPYSAKVTLTSDAFTQITSIPLTAGIWEVSGAMAGYGGTCTYVRMWIGQTTGDWSEEYSANWSTNGKYAMVQAQGSGGHFYAASIPGRISITSTTTLYLWNCNQFSGTAYGYGNLRAIRIS